MINIGIIGFGYMGLFHLEKAKQFADMRVTCAFDTDAEKRRKAEEAGLKAYDSLEDFLREEMELVVIATPNQWHAPYAIQAMKAGKNVLCEKPAVMSVKELEEVIRVSEETGKFFTVHQQRRYDPDYRVVRDVIRSGEIGRVTTIESRVMGERGVCFGWRADPESGGGMLYDWGVHLIDQILMLYPEEKVTSVYARILSVLTPAVDDLFEVTMNLSNGVMARVNVGTFALQKLPRWFVFGDRGTLKLDDFTGTAGGAARIRGDVQGFDSVLGKTSLGPSRTMAPLKPEYLERLELPKEEDMTMAFWSQLHEALVGGEKPAVETAQVLRQMKIVEAAFESSRKNEVVHTEI